jgi:hypothetical protein
MIVKVQCPLVWPRGQEPTILIYNKSRTVELQAPYTEQWQAMFAIMEPALKLFFRAKIVDGKLDITGRPLNYDPGW